jgi:O-antigen ligase
MTATSVAAREEEVVLNRNTTVLAEGRWFSLGRILLMTILLTAPLAFGAVQVWAWTVLAVATVAVLCCWAIGCLRRQDLTIHWSPLYVPAALLLLLGMMQLLTRHTLDRIGTREGVIKLTTYVLLFFLVGQLFQGRSPRFWHRLGMTVTIYTFALSLFAILQFFARPELIYWTVKPRVGSHIFGPYVNHNHYAGLMEMLIPLVVAFLIMQPKGHLWRWLISLTVTVSFASVMLSASRGGLASLSFESAIFGVILLIRSRGSWRPGTGIVAFAISLAIALFLWMAPPSVLARLQTLVLSPEMSFAERKQMSLDSIRMFQEHVWVGTGLGSFEVAYPSYQSIPTDLVIDHAHNDFAEVLAETGSAGGLLILMTLVLFFKRSLRRVQGSLQDITGCICSAAAIGCCGLLIHSFADFNLHIPANACWFVFVTAIAMS